MDMRILNLIRKGQLVLFLGAGASIGSKDRRDRDLLLGSGLAKILVEEMGEEYNNEPLNVVYSAATNMLGTQRVSEILEDRFSGCVPSEAYKTIALYPWSRVYTLNIDDAFESALRQLSPQNINIRHNNDPIVDQDQSYNSLDLIKLNGSVDRTSEGIIFSPQEYGAASADNLSWYEELAHDYFRSPFLFIGTKLSEPLFYHHIERHRQSSNSIEPMSYILTPSITSLEKKHFSSSKLSHISATTSDFSEFLKKNCPHPPTTTDIATARRPELRVLYEMLDAGERDKYISILNCVTAVTRRALENISPETGEIRGFYKGFKPRWRDIVDEIPARLTVTDAFIDLFSDLSKVSHLIAAFGPAGSGKTTLLMQTAYILNERDGIKTYFLDEPVDSLREIVAALDKANSGKYLLFSDALDLLADQIIDILASSFSEKCIFVVSERQHIWEERAKNKIVDFLKASFEIPLINDMDAEKILEKLKNYGPWTKLQKMKHDERIQELVHRSKRQLLIGLLESTSGIGFEEIIEKEFSQISDKNQRMFILLVGLGTAHRSPMKPALLTRALSNLGIFENPYVLLKKLSGIVYIRKDSFWIRHPTYVRQLFDSVVNPEDAHNAVKALLIAFSAYRSPVLKVLSQSDKHIFKSTINHKFLRDIFRNDPNRVLNVYQRFETIFSSDGLYWLQYGLALRDFDDQEGAFEKLRTACDAYPMAHTEHALAHQMLILALLSDNKDTAMRYLEDATSILQRLDAALKSDDTYPIVTLSEGHTQISARFDGIDAGRKTAKRYLEIIRQKFGQGYMPLRVKDTNESLLKYSLTGAWSSNHDWPGAK